MTHEVLLEKLPFDENNPIPNLLHPLMMNFIQTSFRGSAAESRFEWTIPSMIRCAFGSQTLCNASKIQPVEAWAPFLEMSQNTHMVVTVVSKR